MRQKVEWIQDTPIIKESKSGGLDGLRSEGCEKESESHIITAVIAAVILYKTLPYTELYKRLIPFTPQKSADGFTISKGYETLIGEIGKTTTDLRPSGKVEIQGKTYQAFSHGDYIDKDAEIMVDSIDENQLQVEKV